VASWKHDRQWCRVNRLSDACGHARQADVGCLCIVGQALNLKGSKFWNQRVWRRRNILYQNRRRSLRVDDIRRCAIDGTRDVVYVDAVIQTGAVF